MEAGQRAFVRILEHPDYIWFVIRAPVRIGTMDLPMKTGDSLVFHLHFQRDFRGL